MGLVRCFLRLPLELQQPDLTLLELPQLLRRDQQPQQEPPRLAIVPKIGKVEQMRRQPLPFLAMEQPTWVFPQLYSLV